MITLEQLPHMAELMPEILNKYSHANIQNHAPEQIFCLGLMLAVDTYNHYAVLVSYEHSIGYSGTHGRCDIRFLPVSYLATKHPIKSDTLIKVTGDQLR